MKWITYYSFKVRIQNFLQDVKEHAIESNYILIRFVTTITIVVCEDYYYSRRRRRVASLCVSFRFSVMRKVAVSYVVRAYDVNATVEVEMVGVGIAGVNVSVWEAAVVNVGVWKAAIEKAGVWKIRIRMRSRERERDGIAPSRFILLWVRQRCVRGITLSRNSVWS